MSRASRKRSRPPEPAGDDTDRGAAAAAVLLIAALAGSALAVDAAAEASFDAPKRLTALALTAAAAAAAFLWPGHGESFAAIWRASSRPARAGLLLAAAALAGAGISALASPRRTMSLAALRGILLMALLLPLGASRVAARRGRTLLAAFLILAALNGAVSLLQERGIWRPFSLEAIGSRDVTGAFVGNVGYLATTLALAAVAALGVAVATRSVRLRVACLASAVFFLAALAVNQNLTSLVAAAAGGAALFFVRLGRRALLPTAAVVAGVVVALAAYPQTRARAAEAFAHARAGDWDRLLTYRLGPWAAAVEMARERPLVGFGPGTFGAEFVPHRLKAEMRARRRFVNPLVSSTYGEAHSEPLQAAAEGGLAGFAAVASAGVVLVVLARASRRSGGAGAEAGWLFAFLVTGAVASLTWFPLQRPVSAIPLLLAAGRGWRVAAGAGPVRT
jgi:O-antigen ligase